MDGTGKGKTFDLKTGDVLDERKIIVHQTLATMWDGGRNDEK